MFGVPKYVLQIVSNNSGVDVDKLDYLQRDVQKLCYETKIDFANILDSVHVDENENLTFGKKNDSLLLALRSAMHKNFYKHPRVLQANKNMSDKLVSRMSQVERAYRDNLLQLTDKFLQTINL